MDHLIAEGQEEEAQLKVAGTYATSRFTQLVAPGAQVPAGVLAQPLLQPHAHAHDAASSASSTAPSSGAAAGCLRPVRLVFLISTCAILHSSRGADFPGFGQLLTPTPAHMYMLMRLPTAP